MALFVRAGADAKMAVKLKVGSRVTRAISLLALATDNEFGNAAPDVWNFDGKRLELPVWSSRGLQREVVAALIAAGAASERMIGAREPYRRRDLHRILICAIPSLFALFPPPSSAPRQLASKAVTSTSASRMSRPTRASVEPSPGWNKLTRCATMLL